MITGFLITSYKFIMQEPPLILEIAACVTRSLSLFAMLRICKVVAVATFTFEGYELKELRIHFLLSRTIRTLESMLNAARTFANSAVFGAVNERASTARIYFQQLFSE